MALWLEHRTLTRENPASNPLAVVSKFGQFCSPHVASEYLAIDSGGYVNDQSSCSNCSIAKCFPEMVLDEQVCQVVKFKVL